MFVSRHHSDHWIKNKIVDVSVKQLNGHVEEHWHEFYEIELILSGSGIYTIDGIDYKITENRLFLMSPSSFHAIDFTSDTNIINFMFVSDVGNCDFLCRLFSEAPHIAMTLSATDTALFRTLALDMIKNNYVPYLISALNFLLGKCLLCYSPEPLTLKNAQMKYALLYIQNHFREDISLDDVARVAHYSQNYFGNKFKEYMGVSLKTYITNLRFSLAEKLLTRTTLPVSEICFSCGFPDYSNFMYYFKKKYGITPRQYRAKHGTGHSSK